MEALATAPKPSLALEDMAAIVGELARVKSRQDVEAMLAIHHPDGVLLSPPLGARSEGVEQLRKGLETFSRFAPDYSVTLSGQAANNDSSAPGVRSASHPPAPFAATFSITRGPRRRCSSSSGSGTGRSFGRASTSTLPTTMPSL